MPFLQHLAIDDRGLVLRTPFLVFTQMQTRILLALRQRSLSLLALSKNCDSIAVSRKYEEADRCFARIEEEAKKQREKVVRIRETVEKAEIDRRLGIGKCGQQIVESLMDMCEDDVNRRAGERLRSLLEEMGE